MSGKRKRNSPERFEPKFSKATAIAKHVQLPCDDGSHIMGADMEEGHEGDCDPSKGKGNTNQEYVKSKSSAVSKSAGKAAVAQSRMAISMPSDGHLRPTTAEPLNSILYVLNGQVEQGTVVAKHKKAKAAKDGWFSVTTEDGAKQYLLFKPEGKGSVWDFGKLSGSYGQSHPADLAAAGTIQPSASPASAAQPRTR